MAGNAASKRDNSLKVKWGDQCTKFLVGKTVKFVRYMTQKEVDANDWYSAGLVIQFTDGSWIYPSADDEGNDAGALFTSDEKLPVIPVI